MAKARIDPKKRRLIENLRAKVAGGDVEAMVDLAIWLENLGQTSGPDGAEAWLRTAARAGSERGARYLHAWFPEASDDARDQPDTSSPSPVSPVPVTRDPEVRNRPPQDPDVADRGAVDPREEELRGRVGGRWPDPQSMLMLGDLLHRRGDLDGALTWWRKCAAREWASRDIAMNSIGDVLRAQGIIDGPDGARA